MKSIDFINNLEEEFPIKPKYFKEDVLSQTYILDSCYPDIDDLVDFIGSVEIENFSFKQEDIARSIEGNYMSGEKVITSVKLKGKLTYNTSNKNASVNIIFFEFIKNMIIVIPKKINNKYTCDLLRAEKFTISPYIEALHCRRIDLRRIHICAILFVDFKFC